MNFCARISVRDFLKNKTVQMERGEMEDVYSGLDFTMEESLKAIEKSNEHGRDRRICICGHSMKRHEDASGRGVLQCSTGKQNCPCKKPRAVLETSDTRNFMRKTIGSGSMHALGLGIAGAVNAGHGVTWLIELKCDKCGAEGTLSPTAVTQNGVVKDEATGFDALLCRECRRGA